MSECKHRYEELYGQHGCRVGAVGGSPLCDNDEPCWCWRYQRARAEAAGVLIREYCEAERAFWQQHDPDTWPKDRGPTLAKAMQAAGARLGAASDALYKHSGVLEYSPEAPETDST